MLSVLAPAVDVCQAHDTREPGGTGKTRIPRPAIASGGGKVRSLRYPWSRHNPLFRAVVRKALLLNLADQSDPNGNGPPDGSIQSEGERGYELLLVVTNPVVPKVKYEKKLLSEAVLVL